jgi:hypothetical protein
LADINLVLSKNPCLSAGILALDDVISIDVLLPEQLKDAANEKAERKNARLKVRRSITYQ